MSESVRIKVDLSSGTVEIEADAAQIDNVFERLETFVPRLSEAYGARPVETAGGQGNSQTFSETPKDAEGSSTTKAKPSGRTTSRARETYSIVDLGLKEDQRTAMRQYYETKQPRNQNEQTAVVMDWLRREAGKTAVTLNEIFTGFRTVNIKAPGKISSVLGNMVGQGWIKNAGPGKFELTHVGEDYVKFDLPPKAPQKK